MGDQITTKKMVKKEDPHAYAKLANEGTLLGYPVKINGQTHRPDNNISYHASLKEFNKDKDHPHAIHELAQHLPLNPPDAKNTQIEPDQFKDRFGNDVFVIKLKGNSAEKMKEHNGKFAHMGYTPKFEWSPHVSVDKGTWDKVKSSGAKTAHDAGISFGSAELKRGPKTIKTYHHQADSAEPKFPDHSDFTSKVNVPVTKTEKLRPLMKPYVSEAQRRWAHTPTGEKALGGESGVHEWDKATKGKRLPEKIGKNDLEKGALKNAGIALGMAGALAGAAPNTDAGNHFSNSVQQSNNKPQYDHAKMLRAISQVESSGGQNTNHRPTSQGVAFGKYALMPNTIHDTIKGHKDLNSKHGRALALNGPQLHRYMQDHKDLEDIIANRHLSHIEHNFGNNIDNIGFSWNQGITGTKHAKNKGVDVANHPYTKKIREAYRKEK